jgi:hypothetical protein
MMVTHNPVPIAHDVHAPLHVEELQQKPSLHWPVVHCALVVQAPPGMVCGTHALAALQ